MKVVVTIATLDPEHGGPARTVPALCRALTRQGAQLELITVADRGRQRASLETNGFNATIIETEATRYQPRAWFAPFRSALSRAVSGRNDAVIYDVGLWLPSNHLAAQVAARTNVPLVISPRGMLSRKALAVSKWKKIAAWYLYQRRNLKRAKLLHVTSDGEARDLRARNLSQPIAIVPNAVDVQGSVATRTPSGEAVRTVLFLSRIHPIKGLKDLVHAWARVRPSCWRVIVAGPDENAHRTEVESLIASLGLQSDFEFIGSVDDEKKWRLLAGADLFVLPSYSESFGLAIAEAMAAALPVITTRATPWSELVSRGCGWWVPTGVDALTESLASAMALNRHELREMGERGRALIGEKYSWDSVAARMLEAFRWLIGKGARPDWLL